MSSKRRLISSVEGLNIVKYVIWDAHCEVTKTVSQCPDVFKGRDTLIRDTAELEDGVYKILHGVAARCMLRISRLISTVEGLQLLQYVIWNALFEVTITVSQCPLVFRGRAVLFRDTAEFADGVYKILHGVAA